MPNGVDIANGIAAYFKKGRSASTAGANDGAGDADSADSQKAVHDELAGQICPDCHAAVKGAMVTAFGQPANVANADDVTKDQVDAANMEIKRPINPLDKIRDPNGYGVVRGE